MTEYRLPGVYSQEVEGPKLGVNYGGSPIPCFIGPAVGYQTATQIVNFEGTDPTQLTGTGIIADSYVVTSRLTGASFKLGTDYVATQNVDGVTSIRRNVIKLSTATTDVAGKTVTFYAAQPAIDLHDVAGLPEGAYVVAGTLSVQNGKVTYQEGVSYDVDYYAGKILAKSGDNMIPNATSLTIGFKWTTAEPLELVGEASFQLSHRYISDKGMSASGKDYSAKIVSGARPSVAGQTVNYGETPGAADGYQEGVDFVIDYDNGRIARTASSRIPSFDATLKNYFYVEFGYCPIKDGESCVVKYEYTDADYSKPKYFETMDELYAAYGTPWDYSTGKVQSPLSLAAYLANRNGMGSCWCCAVAGGGTTPYQWDDAFNALTSVYGIDVIVPLSGEQSVWEKAKSHLQTMIPNQDERVAIIGADGTQYPVEPTTMMQYARSFSADDVWLVGPSSFKYRNPITSVVEPIAGYYMAAAIAGYESSVPQYTPLTNKVIGGFYGANENYTKVTKKNMCGNGVMYVDDKNGAMTILHGHTTSTDSIIKQECNIIITKYFIIKSMRNMYENGGYIGSILNAATLLGVKVAAQNLLINLQEANYLSSFSGLAVRINPNNPTQIDVQFMYQPMYALEYIFIEFAVDASVPNFTA